MKKKYRSVLKWINNYLIFFMLVAFVITCCTMLFVSVLSKSLGVTLTDENLSTAAKLTFGNVLLLSLLFAVIDAIRRKITVDRPVKSITEAANRMIQGDFSVRIKKQSRFASYDSFSEITDCFNKMAQELESVETLRTDFVSNVSHEMKTPLAAIQNYSALLKTPDLTDEERLEYAQGVENATKRLSDMITNILRLNRLENQQIYPTPTQYRLSEQLCESLLQFESVWEKEDIEIETDIEDDIIVKADKELFSLVWSNLLSNAFKFTPKGGKVSVSLFETENHTVVRISDTGCGMTPEVGKHIFEKFYQGDTSRSSQGNGLGLALVKRIIDITQSEISVESSPQSGSAFTVRIRK